MWNGLVNFHSFCCYYRESPYPWSICNYHSHCVLADFRLHKRTERLTSLIWHTPPPKCERFLGPSHGVDLRELRAFDPKRPAEFDRFLPDHAKNNPNMDYDKIKDDIAKSYQTKWMDWLILIVFSIILGVILGFLDPPKVLGYAIMIVAIMIFIYVFPGKSKKDDWHLFLQLSFRGNYNEHQIRFTHNFHTFNPFIMRNWWTKHKGYLIIRRCRIKRKVAY